jgi:hypothetical protein
MVTFRPDMSYQEAMIKGRKQDEILMEICDKGLEEMMTPEEILLRLQ